MSRRRPSGRGSNSRRFAEVSGPDGSKTRVPAVKDAGTFVYIREHDGSWPSTPVTTLLYDAAWMTEGAVFEVVDMRPGRGMGTTTTVQAVEVRLRIAVHPGKYGQTTRLVLVTEVESDDTFAVKTLDDLEGVAS